MPAKKAIPAKAGPDEQTGPVWAHSLLTDYDIFLFVGGQHFRMYEKMGSHPLVLNGVSGTHFAVWAPNAREVHVMGDFNAWSRSGHPLSRRADTSGIWEGFIPGAGKGDLYKYFILGYHGQEIEKGDPYARRWETPPRTASMIWDTAYAWSDKKWISKRAKTSLLHDPMSVYEVHLGSWRRDPAEPKRILTCRETAAALIPYLLEMNFTHVELMPVMEFPYIPSWGYQITGYFGASSRYGTPQDLMYLIDELHKNNIGVILDWVPSHFPGDAHGLYEFDGTHLYEHADMRKGFHPDWKSYIFNYDKNEVRSFLISNALFWLEQYHADGLRVDAVASMLYYDFSRTADEAAFNDHGGRENLGAIQFLKDLNIAVYGNFKGVHTIAEESSTYPGVTHPVHSGGLGFGMKWMMGWMNDTLAYFKLDPLARKHHHHKLTFSITYAFTENFMLPFSHDEVVHGKSPMVYKMPGDEWQKFANLRTLYGYLFTHPGTKLLFMGDEFGQTKEWRFRESLDWHLLEFPAHRGMQETVRKLNELYRKESALHHFNFSYEGFEWIDADNANESVYVYKRKGKKESDTLVIALNLTPVVRQGYRIPVHAGGRWAELFNSDDTIYYGSGYVNPQGVVAAGTAETGFSIQTDLPALSVVIFKRRAR
ncbi:1,4-alpha-glucan branching protein GlgB [Pedobacter yulinensis]|uniref:1,4-alpha-glucan branching enzyme GlgB n=1 Tax=Pedobacter yulinensis TaxID=2126353 RepID=A0A2T3HHH6_9SPHI|nr:1,4-alpha-glucan branching protein GlgB [Pedobacter yulinensis]PST81906.1 1,4-alpha-glucan branching protein GlgB [Pedobacter yulinensis]